MGPAILRTDIEADAMPDADDVRRETALVLANAFDLEPPSGPTLDDVRRLLTVRVAELLNDRPEMLMSLLYRIDVDERAVKQVLTEAPMEDIPDRLAELIIRRQLQKVETRRRYRS